MSDDRPAFPIPAESDVTPLMRERERMWTEYHKERRGPPLAEVLAEARRRRDERNAYRAGEAARRRRP